MHIHDDDKKYDESCDCPLCLLQKIMKEKHPHLNFDFILIVPSKLDLEDNWTTSTINLPETWVRLGHVRNAIRDKLMNDDVIKKTDKKVH